jgi:methyltransferase family protein
MIIKTLAKLPLSILNGKTNIGFCPICEHKTLFIRQTEWLRDHYYCIFCWSVPRQRALIKVLQQEFPDWRRMKIYESSPCGASSRKLRKECEHYLPSQFYPEVQPGACKRGFRCENLEKMTFGDGSFDLVITQDVFEHVLNPAPAFREIARVLKPGGAHIFTVPLYKGQKTVIRAAAEGNEIQYFEDPMYHGNPVDKKGSLVVTDWGDDMGDFIRAKSGLTTEIFTFHEQTLGLEAAFLDVFVSRKN